MRAAIFHTVSEPLEIQDVSIDLPKTGEVLIRLAASGLCHTDLHFMQGHLSVELPAILGHEAAGIVEKVGEGVSYVKPGDHVIACLSVFCGQCSQCLSGHPAICEQPDITDRSQGQTPRLSFNEQPVFSFMRLGAFAEQILVHQNAIVKIRRDMPLEQAALLGCGVTTGLGAVFNNAAVKPGSSVAVLGCGTIGLNAIQGARICGAQIIIAVDTNADKLKTAETFGATDLINPADGDIVEQIIDLTDGAGVQYSFEAVGSAVTARQAFLILAKGATAVIIGLMGTEEEVSLPGLHFLAERRIQGCDMGSNRFRVDIPMYVELYMQGQLELDNLISRRISLDEINTGFDDMVEGKTVRSVITFDH